MAEWNAELSPLLRSYATEGVTGRILAYKHGDITLEQLEAEFARHTFVTPARMAGKHAGETMAEIERRVEDATFDTPGSWDEVNGARASNLLNAQEYAAIAKAAYEGHKAS